MGTNYHILRNICDCCGRSSDYEGPHIGKGSWGNAFLFQTNEELGITCGSQWFEYLTQLDYDDRIYNEYGEVQDVEEFIDYVISTKNMKNYGDVAYDGFRISNRDFC